MDLSLAPDNLDGVLGLYEPAAGPVTDAGSLFHSRLLGPIVKEILAGHPIVPIKGAPGSGKTSFLHVLAMDLWTRQLGVAVVAEPGATPKMVQASLEYTGGLTGRDGDPARLLRALWHEAGLKRLVVLCDNSESLPPATFHYLSRLLKSSVTQPITLQLVLIGETGAWPGLEEASLNGLRAAAGSSYTTMSLRQDEARAYLDYRLRQTGQTLDGVMTPAAAAELCEQARGNARRLDGLARRALLYGYNHGHARLTARRVRAALLADGAAPARHSGWGLAQAGVAASLCLMVAAGLAVWLGGRASLSPAHAVIGMPRMAAPRATASQARPAETVPAVAPQPPPIAPTVLANSGASPTAPKATPQHPAEAAAPSTRLNPGPAKASPELAAAAMPRRPSGLVLVAGPHDTMPALYARVYKGLTPPAYATVLAVNEPLSGLGPVRPGALLIFPAPPQGWTAH